MELELGYDRTPCPRSVPRLRTAVFVQRNDNILTPGQDERALRRVSGGGIDSLAQNSGYSDAVGGELGIKGQSLSGFRWNASYAFEVISDHRH